MATISAFALSAYSNIIVPKSSIPRVRVPYDINKSTDSSAKPQTLKNEVFSSASLYQFNLFQSSPAVNPFLQKTSFNPVLLKNKSGSLLKKKEPLIEKDDRIGIVKAHKSSLMPIDNLKIENKELTLIKENINLIA